MRRRWGTHAVIALLLLLVVGIATGDTGGSMGGGDWGGGGGGGYSSGGGGGGGWSSSSSSGGGGWSSSSSGRSSSSGGDGWSSSSNSNWSSSSGGCEGSSSHGQGSGCHAIGLVIVVGIVFVTFIIFIFTSHDFGSPTPLYDAPSGVDVSVLRIAVDGRARKFVQTELARIAKSANTATNEGRATMLREVALLLRKLRDAWVYGGADNHPLYYDQRGAKAVFDRAVDAARSRFREEVIRNADGSIVTRQPSEYTPKSHEGAGVILVSLIIAARRELFTVQRIHDGDELRQALESASQLTPGNLVAIEIVWQPAEDSDRLSSMELEAKYPRPDLIPLSGALVGKTFCDYCTGPYPAELVSCPHCGAPTKGRELGA